MRTTPWLYYQFFVVPNFEDYWQDKADVRLAFNASTAAFQQAEIFFAYYQRHDPWRVAAWPKMKEFLIELTLREPRFLTVQSVATAYKHLYPSGGHYDTGSPMSLTGLVFPSDGTQLLVHWGEREDFSDSDVIVRRRDRTKISLGDSLERVVYGLWPRIIPEDPGYD